MADLTSLIRTLTEKTEQGRLRWQKAGNALRAQLPDGSCFELQCDTSTAGITTKAAGGEPVPGLTTTGLGAFAPNFAVLNELAALAARSAGPADGREASVLAAVSRL